MLNRLYLKRLAAPSVDVTDLRLEIHDTNTGIDQDMGFSIKSYIGGPPTLLNASAATNFIYRVKELTDRQMELVNGIDIRRKIIDRIKQIEDFGGEFEFKGTASETFNENLIMIDSLMDTIMGEMVLYSFKSNTKDCRKLIDYLEETNPVGYHRAGMYEYKFKQLLCAKVLGMTPGKP